MDTQFLGKMAIGGVAFGAAAAAFLFVAATNLPSTEAELGVLGVELSVSIGDAPAATSPASLEASMMHRSPDNRESGVALRVARSGGPRAPAALAHEAPAARAAAAPPMRAPCPGGST